MREYQTRVAEVCSRLNADGVRYILVGATAMHDDLIVSKQTGRLQDAADIEVLEQIKRFRAEMIPPASL